MSNMSNQKSVTVTIYQADYDNLMNTGLLLKMHDFRNPFKGPLPQTIYHSDGNLEFSPLFIMEAPEVTEDEAEALVQRAYALYKADWCARRGYKPEDADNEEQVEQIFSRLIIELRNAREKYDCSGSAKRRRFTLSRHACEMPDITQQPMPALYMSWSELDGWQTVPYYVVDDAFPYGHGEKSVYLIRKHMFLSDEEAMAIRWHMGDFSDPNTSKSYNLYPLAAQLHIADLQATYLDEAVPIKN